VRLPRLRTRLTIWFAASILLIVTPVLAALVASQWRAMRSALDHHLEEDLEVAAEMLVAGEQGVVWRSDSSSDPGYDNGRQRWVEVYGLDGGLLFVRGLASRSEIRAALESPSAGRAGYRTFTTPAGAHVRSLSEKRSLAGRDVWIRVVRTEDDLRADLRSLILALSILGPMSVLAAALSGYVISGRALSPLSRMAERARFISADRLSERLPVENAHDELGQLASVFNETFARLEESFARLKRFTADASHELRTPLTAIKTVGEVGLREARSPDAYREIIGSMLEEADHLAHMVDTLLTLSRWESGRARVAAEAVNLRQLAGGVVAQLAVLGEERDVAIELNVDAANAVSTDPIMAGQAVANVIDNAIKYTPPGGRVRIWSRSSDAFHQLIVDDEGPGIPEAERRHVLERFYRIADGERTAGSGLGLAIVHWAMAANHGRIDIGEAPGGGTRVLLSWPSVQS
jgi:heavy metal sensor kinase